MRGESITADDYFFRGKKIPRNMYFRLQDTYRLMTLVKKGVNTTSILKKRLGVSTSVFTKAKEDGYLKVSGNYNIERLVTITECGEQFYNDWRKENEQKRMLGESY